MAVGPTVLVLEDLQWADPTSLRLTEAARGTGPGTARCLVLHPSP